MENFLYGDILYTYTTFKPFIILKKHRDEMEAKRLAEAEYEEFAPMLKPYIKREVRIALRERYADEGLIGYLIRIELQSIREVE